MIGIDGTDTILLFIVALIAIFAAYKIGFRNGHTQGFGAAQNLSLQRIIRAQARVDALTDKPEEEFPDDFEFKDIR